MDLKAEIVDLIDLIDEILSRSDFEYRLVTAALFRDLRSSLNNLLKHEAFQTTEPRMTKEGMSTE